MFVVIGPSRPSPEGTESPWERLKTGSPCASLITSRTPPGFEARGAGPSYHHGGGAGAEERPIDDCS